MTQEKLDLINSILKVILGCDRWMVVRYDLYKLWYVSADNGEMAGFRGLNEPDIESKMEIAIKAIQVTLQTPDYKALRFTSPNVRPAK